MPDRVRAARRRRSSSRGNRRAHRHRHRHQQGAPLSREAIASPGTRTMSCELTRDRLDALIAGTLDPASEAQARAHLASCAECSEDYEAARFVAPRAAALPREKPSDRDLWAGIE